MDGRGVADQSRKVGGESLGGGGGKTGKYMKQKTPNQLSWPLLQHSIPSLQRPLNWKIYESNIVFKGEGGRMENGVTKREN